MVFVTPEAEWHAVVDGNSKRTHISAGGADLKRSQLQLQCAHIPSFV